MYRTVKKCEPRLALQQSVQIQSRSQVFRMGMPYFGPQSVRLFTRRRDFAAAATRLFGVFAPQRSPTTSTTKESGTGAGRG